MQAVRIVNQSDRDFVYYHGTRHVIPPSGNVPVETHVAKCWFGDWDSRNRSAYDRPRDDEISRLHILYGAYDDVEVWESNKPQEGVFVTSIDGERITTLIEDPEGKSQSVDATDSEEFARLASMFEQNQAENAALKARLEYLESQKLEGITTHEPLDEDNPKTRRNPPPPRRTGKPIREEDGE